MSPLPPMLRLIRTATAVSRNKRQNLANRYNLQISCRVKPYASGDREGITAVEAEKVDVCVAAVPRNGESNAAVSRVFAKSFKTYQLTGIIQVFNVAKSDVGIIHGLKSRDKVICIADLEIGTESEEEYLQRAHRQLQEAVIQK
ncbi:hypothetical protein BJX76DRAFT_353623 [Aspergillus varians]